MRKVTRLKSWLYLPEAAEHISAEVGEQITPIDLVQLALDERLRLSWFAHGIPVRKVAKYTQLFPNWSKSDFEGSKQNNSKGRETWGPIDEEEDVFRFNGPCRLEIRYCLTLKEQLQKFIIYSQPLKPTFEKEDLSIHGFLVSDDEGQILQIVDYYPFGTLQQALGGIANMKPGYHPTNRLAGEHEWIMQRTDIEAFVQSLLGNGQPKKQHETEVDYILNRFLDVTDGKGGKPQLSRYMLEELSAEFIPPGRFEWVDPTGKAHKRSEKRLLNRLSDLRKQRKVSR